MEEKTKEQKITEQIQLSEQLMKVTSAVKENITQDYTLAQFDKTEKEYISENYENAEFAKEIITKYAKNGYTYKFNDQKGDWERNEDNSIKRIKIEKEEEEKIKQMSERIFNFFMVKPHMLSVLNRNKEHNILLNILGKSPEEEKPVVYNNDDRSILQKIKERLSGNKEEKFEED